MRSGQWKTHIDLEIWSTKGYELDICNLDICSTTNGGGRADESEAIAVGADGLEVRTGVRHQQKSHQLSGK